MVGLCAIGRDLKLGKRNVIFYYEDRRQEKVGPLQRKEVKIELTTGEIWTFYPTSYDLVRNGRMETVHFKTCQIGWYFVSDKVTSRGFVKSLTVV